MHFSQGALGPRVYLMSKNETISKHSCDRWSHEVQERANCTFAMDRRPTFAPQRLWRTRAGNASVEICWPSHPAFEMQRSSNACRTDATSLRPVTAARSELLGGGN